jgi:hypothetical protein
MTGLTPYFCTRAIYLVDSHTIARFFSSLTIFLPRPPLSPPRILRTFLLAA